jgi:hypothetical protein
MRFEILMNDAVIHQAAWLVTEHHADESFLAMVIAHKNYNLYDGNSSEIAEKLLDTFISMKIKPYKTWNPYSKVIGYASGNTIYVNTRKLNLPLKDRVANFIHEPLHLLGYSHKGNSVNAFNLGTVPYKVSAIFVKYLESIGKL